MQRRRRGLDGLRVNPLAPGGTGGDERRREQLACNVVPAGRRAARARRCRGRQRRSVRCPGRATPVRVAPVRERSSMTSSVNPSGVPSSVMITTACPRRRPSSTRGATSLANPSAAPRATTASSRSARSPSFSARRSLSCRFKVDPRSSWSGPAPSTMPTARARKIEMIDTRWYRKSITRPILAARTTGRPIGRPRPGGWPAPPGSR